MTIEDIVRYRLINQQIVGSKFKKPEEVVRWFGAIQAQEYPSGLWAVGYHAPGTTMADVERAIADHKIVRTWPMRGTLHFVAAEDAKWMLKLMAEKVAVNRDYYRRQIGITEADIKKAQKALTKALTGGKQLTRAGIYEVFQKIGIQTHESRGLHIIGYLAQMGMICLATHQGKQPTFALLDEWVPNSRKLSPEESLAEIVLRYFTSHGPATIYDLAWWSGLKMSDIRVGIEMNKGKLRQEVLDGKTYWMPRNIPDITMSSPTAHLLAAYDEFLIAYKDRSASLRPEDQKQLYSPGNLIFSAAIIIDGMGVGLWKRTLVKKDIVLTIRLFRKLTKPEKSALTVATARYQIFIGTPLKTTFSHS